MRKFISIELYVMVAEKILREILNMQVSFVEQDIIANLF